MDRFREPRTGKLLAGLWLCLVFPGVAAIESLSVSLGTLEGRGWRLEDVALQLSFQDDGSLQAELDTHTAQLPDPIGKLQALALRCAMLHQQGAVLICRKGSLRADSAWLGALAGGARWRLDRASGDLQLELEELSLLEGGLDLRLALGSDGWQADLQLHALPVAALRTLAAPWQAWPEDWTFSGALSGEVQVSGDDGLRRVKTRVQPQELDFTNTEGTRAGQGLRGVLEVEARPRGTGWSGQVRLRAEAGQLYSDPLYFEFSRQRPVEVRADLALADGRLSVDSFQWRHQDTLEVEGGAGFDLQPAPALSRIHLDIHNAYFPSAFTTYLQPWLVDTSFAELRTAGSLQGGLRYHDGQITDLQLELDSLDIEDPRGRLDLTDVNGRLDWAEDQIPRRQHIRWRSGHLYRLALGALDAELVTAGRQVTLAGPVQLPVLDGSLQVDRFEIRYGEDLAWSLDAALTPISMREFTLALDWPEMAGTLSGMIPSVRYADGELEVGGTLLVGVFDGDITVRNLRLEQPLGLVPRLWADIRIDGLDLETLTRTFAFGKIEGRIDGAVEDLYLEAWQPVAFDAWLATPKVDDSRHRISQRAVDNLTDLGGGGVGGALSRGFLQFLEDFPYQALGVRCRLEDGICQMGGVEPAEQGYYLVKGTFLPPRINVIGYEDRVDWDTLLDRLQTVTAEQGPVVQ